MTLAELDLVGFFEKATVATGRLTKRPALGGPRRRVVGSASAGDWI
jgi:hypothetical protein